MPASSTAVRISPIEVVFRQKGALKAAEKMSKAEFIQFALDNETLRMERESDGTVIIMPLVFGGSGKRENLMGFYVRHWQMQTGLGEVYSSATGFDLPDGSTRAPDTAWVSDEQLATLSEDDEEFSFLPLAPDFVAEVRSSSDRLPKQKAKMKETWMANGVRLGWLIDPFEEKVYIFRENGEEETVEGFEGKTLSGEAVMPGLVVPLDKLRLKKKKK
jgi:Uma2 family endonuclease